MIIVIYADDESIEPGPTPKTTSISYVDRYEWPKIVDETTYPGCRAGLATSGGGAPSSGLGVLVGLKIFPKIPLDARQIHQQ
jgi:hypothetical protein